MAIKLVSMMDLQPTDLLREDSFSFMISLPPDKINSLGPPFVLDSGDRLLIAEGNHRVAALFGKGKKILYVDYKNIDEVKEVYSFFSEEVLRRQEEMLRRGIISPEDLLVEYLLRPTRFL